MKKVKMTKIFMIILFSIVFIITIFLVMPGGTDRKDAALLYRSMTVEKVDNSKDKFKVYVEEVELVKNGEGDSETSIYYGGEGNSSIPRVAASAGGDRMAQAAKEEYQLTKTLFDPVGARYWYWYDYIPNLVQSRESYTSLDLTNYSKPLSGGWYDRGGAGWCAMFVSCCAQRAGLSTGSISISNQSAPIPWSPNCAQFYNWFYKTGATCVIVQSSSNYRTARSQWVDYVRKVCGGKVYEVATYTPVPGDIMFLDWDENEMCFSHVEIVVACDGQTITSISGNSQGDGQGGQYYRSSKVVEHKFGITKEQIVGYVHPSYEGF